MAAMRALLTREKPEMKSCCREEARRSVKRHRDVATCDGCGALILAYDNDKDFDGTLAELSQHDIEPETGELGELKLVVKPTNARN